MCQLPWRTPSELAWGIMPLISPASAANRALKKGDLPHVDQTKYIHCLSRHRGRQALQITENAVRQQPDSQTDCMEKQCVAAREREKGTILCCYFRL